MDLKDQIKEAAIRLLGEEIVEGRSVPELVGLLVQEAEMYRGLADRDQMRVVDLTKLLETTNEELESERDSRAAEQEEHASVVDDLQKEKDDLQKSYDDNLAKWHGERGAILGQKKELEERVEKLEGRLETATVGLEDETTNLEKTQTSLDVYSNALAKAAETLRKIGAPEYDPNKPDSMDDISGKALNIVIDLETRRQESEQNMQQGVQMLSQIYSHLTGKEAPSGNYADMEPILGAFREFAEEGNVLERLANLEYEVKSAGENKDKLEEDIETLKKELTDLPKKHTAATRQVRDLLEEEKKKVTELKGKISDLNKHIATVYKPALDFIDKVYEEHTGHKPRDESDYAGNLSYVMRKITRERDNIKEQIDNLYFALMEEARPKEMSYNQAIARITEAYDLLSRIDGADSHIMQENQLLRDSLDELYALLPGEVPVEEKISGAKRTPEHQLAHIRGVYMNIAGQIKNTYQAIGKLEREVGELEKELDEQSELVRTQTGKISALEAGK